jgi:hypothetical protein
MIYVDKSLEHHNNELRERGHLSVNKRRARKKDPKHPICGQKHDISRLYGNLSVAILLQIYDEKARLLTNHCYVKCAGVGSQGLHCSDMKRCSDRKRAAGAKQGKMIRRHLRRRIGC